MTEGRSGGRSRKARGNVFGVVNSVPILTKIIIIILSYFGATALFRLRGGASHGRHG